MSHLALHLHPRPSLPPPQDACENPNARLAHLLHNPRRAGPQSVQYDRNGEKLIFLAHDLLLDASEALAINPVLRSAAFSLQRFFGLRPADARRIFSMYPSLLAADPTSDLLPVLRFLTGPASIPFPDVRKSIVRCPRLLVSSVSQQLLPALFFLRQLGFVGPYKITCQNTVLLVSNVEQTLIPKLEYIQSLGFSYMETSKMVLRSPGLLTFSIENNLRPKAEFLVAGMGRDVSELKGFPQYFSFSLSGKIRPRHGMLVKSGISMSLADMLKPSDEEFCKKLVDMKLKF